MDIVIAGLGNPGSKYAKSLHNMGFMVVQKLALKLDIKLKEDSHFQAAVGKKCVGELGVNFYLLCPLTYMNLSGEVIAAYLEEKKLRVSSLLVVADDADLKLGELRMRPFGGSGGQNGLKNIELELGTSDFKRLRVGIGRPEDAGFPKEMSLADYVLTVPQESVWQVLNPAIEKAADALSMLVSKDFEAVQKIVNSSQNETVKSVSGETINEEK